MYTYRVAGIEITDELYHDDLEGMTFGRKDQNELWHSGIKGMSWGNRRFQNEDGSLTMAGRRRYGVGNPKIGVNVEVTDSGTGNARAGAAAGQRATSASRAPIVKPGPASRPSKPNPESHMMRTRTAVPDTGSRSASVSSPGFIARDTARKVGQSAAKGRMAADRLFNTVSGAYNDASKWVNQAGNDVAKTATDAYNKVNYALTGNRPESPIDQYARPRPENRGLLGDIADWAKGAANDVGDWAKGAANDVGDWAKGAYNDASNWVDQNITGNSARNAANNINQAMNNNNSIPDQLRDAYNQQQQKADNSLFGRIGNAARDVGNWASGAYNDASKWVNQAGNDVGDWATDAYNKVNYALTGNRPESPVDQYARPRPENRGLLGDVGDWAKGAANDVGDWAKGAYNDASNWVDQNITGNSARNAANNINQAMNNNSSIPDQLRDAYNQQQQKADNSLFGRIANMPRDVGNWATGAYNDVSNWVNQAGNDASKWANQAGNDASKWVNQAGNDASKWVNQAGSDISKIATDAYNLGTNYSNDPVVRTMMAQLNNPNLEPTRRLALEEDMKTYIDAQKRNNSVANAGQSVTKAVKDMRDIATNYAYDPQVQFYNNQLSNPNIDPVLAEDIKNARDMYIDNLRKGKG